MSSKPANLAGGQEVNLTEGVARGEVGGDQVRFKFTFYCRCLFSFALMLLVSGDQHSLGWHQRIDVPHMHTHLVNLYVSSFFHCKLSLLGILFTYYSFLV
jgi:hypothetical protein